MATSGDVHATECRYTPPQGALKFDLEIHFKIVSKFSPLSTKVLWLIHQFQLLPEDIKELCPCR